MNTTKLGILSVLLLTGALMLAGCTSAPAGTPTITPTSTPLATANAINQPAQATRLDELSNLAGLNTTSAWDGDGLLVSLEMVPSSELDYSIAWGKIFSLGAYSTTAKSVTIANTFEGKEFVRVSAKTADVKALNEGRITLDEFKKRLTYPNDTWEPQQV